MLTFDSITDFIGNINSLTLAGTLQWEIMDLYGTLQTSNPELYAWVHRKVNGFHMLLEDNSFLLAIDLKQSSGLSYIALVTYENHSSKDSYVSRAFEMSLQLTQNGTPVSLTSQHQHELQRLMNSVRSKSSDLRDEKKESFVRAFHKAFNSSQ